MDPRFFRPRFLSQVFILALSASWACSEQTTYQLENAPSGTLFTSVSGEAIGSATADTVVQLRDEESDKPLFAFTPDDDVDFSNLVVQRTDTTTLIHFPDAADASGVGEDITVFVPCNPESSGLRVCANATSTDDMTEACDAAGVLLSRARPESGDYVWENLATRTGIADCELTVQKAGRNVGVQNTFAFSAHVSFQGPEGVDINPDTAPQCALACDDPVLDLGGVSGSYACNAPSITGPTSDISGTKFSCSAIFTAGTAEQTFITRYLTETPAFVWTFEDDATATLDTFHYNYLLPGQQDDLVRCEFQCEAYVEGDGTFDFAVNNTGDLSYTVTGFDTDNLYFLNPNDLNAVLAGIDGGFAGEDTLIITDGNDGTGYDFALSEDDFAHVLGFEAIDLDNGATNGITLDADSVLALSDTGALTIFGDANDAVTLSDASAWTESDNSVEVNSVTCTPFTNGVATLYVQEDVSVE